jgi:steroid 5-alpha reductase family enzyme
MQQHMQFHADQSPSVGPKSAIVGWYVACVAAACWWAFVSPGTAATTGVAPRQAVLVACAALYIGRAAHTLFVFVKRAVPWWEAVWGGSIIGVTLFLYLFEGFRAPSSLRAVDWAALLLYLAGSYLGTASEWMRHAWKADPAHRGHIYTGGLFAWSRHVNYFGDLLLFTGFALLSTAWWAPFVPLGMALNFVFVIIPAHDAYLIERYGEEYARYAAHTKRLIPLVY